MFLHWRHSTGPTIELLRNKKIKEAFEDGFRSCVKIFMAIDPKYIGQTNLAKGWPNG